MADAVDLLVIGGGINGAGIARDAAGRGLSVVLCEKGDLAEATSSRSSKLVHGGLRYLEYYQFRLVHEALVEREVLLRVGAACRLADPFRAAALAAGSAGVDGAPRPVPLRPHRRPSHPAGLPRARPAAANPRAPPCCRATSRVSNTPIAAPTTRG